MANNSIPEATYDGRSFSFSLILGFIFSIVDIATVVGNVLVIASVCWNKRLRTVTNCFIVSLASADLLVGLVVQPLAIKVELTGEWRLGSILCDVWVSADVMLCTASILNLCCISLDRYFAITKPLVYVTKRSKRLAWGMTGAAWLLAFLITCPPMLGWREAGRGFDEKLCILTQSPGYIIFSALGSFYIPLIIMVFVYAKIFFVAYKREQRLKPYRKRFRLRNSSHNSCKDDSDRKECTTNNVQSLPQLNSYPSIESDIPMSDFTDSYSNLQGENRTMQSENYIRQVKTLGNKTSSTFRSYSDRTSSVIDRQERALIVRESKTAKTLAVVVGCFVLCWFPFFLMYLAEPFCVSCNFSSFLKSVCTWLGYCNSGINPFIYAFYNEDFRYSFWRLTCGIVTKSKARRQRSRPVTFI